MSIFIADVDIDNIFYFTLKPCANWAIQIKDLLFSVGPLGNTTETLFNQLEI